MQVLGTTYKKKSNLGGRLVCQVVVFFWGISIAPIISSAQQHSIDPNEYDQLHLKAQSQGSIRIIVGLNLSKPFVPEGKLPPEAVEAQREAIVKAQDALLRRMESFNAITIYWFQFIPSVVMEVSADALVDLVANPQIMSIEEDVPGDPMLIESIPLINADDAWNSGYTGAGQTIAILDTGVDKLHSFLANKVVSEACYSTTNGSTATSVCPNGLNEQIGSGAGVNCPTSIYSCDHGTHVAGIAAGKGSAFSGVAKDATLISIQVFSRFNSSADCSPRPAPCARYYPSDLIKGLERVYALSSSYSIAAVNMSLGETRKFTSACDTDSRKPIIDTLRSVRIATIISSGNNGYTDGITAPACISSAISVGATTKSDTVSSFSNSASFLHLLAPGSSIYSSVPGGGFTYKSGTSMAAPHVAGAWAVFKSSDPAATVDEAFNSLKITGVPTLDTRNNITKPRIDVYGAVSTVVDMPTIAGGNYHTCARLMDGTAKCWGYNVYGQLGNGNTSDSTTPATVTGITTATAVTAGAYHTCALLSDGTVKCWGYNAYGQLGNGKTTNSTTPVTVSGINTATAVAAGDFHTCVLLSNATIKCWGYNLYGQLGNGTTTSSATPVAVSSVSSGSVIAAGGYNTCVVFLNGSMGCWGWNGYGQLGTGTNSGPQTCYSFACSTTPVVINFANTTAVAVGQLHVCARFSDKTISCWGHGLDGQLGNGTTYSDYLAGGSINGITTARGVTAGEDHTCARLSDATIKCWGSNLYGRLGNGTVTDSLVPVPVTGINTATTVKAGDQHTCARLSDGTIKCWGYNAYGQLGVASAPTGYPVTVTGITTASAIFIWLFGYLAPSLWRQHRKKVHSS
jgi:alpha-tubulin suppressor-like RCC1 family protein